MLNGNSLLYKLLLPTAERLEVRLKPDLEVTAIDYPRYATFTGRPGVAINSRGMEAPQAWEWSLDMSFFARSEDEVFAIASDFYDLIHLWNDPYRTPRRDLVPGLGWAAEVSDRSLPSMVATTDLQGHRVVQYAGGWDLQLHAAQTQD